MPIIAGLGNPGQEYARTRHNAGFMLLDRLADLLSVRLTAGKGPYHMAKARHAGVQLLLMKPDTFMNRSGSALQQALHWFKLPPEQCLVCYDDLDLPMGTIRLRPGGSAGGHNGVKDIIRKLGTDAFPRLRIGIGNDFPKGRQVDYVLSDFSAEERKQMDEAFVLAEEAVYTFCRDGIEIAMNQFN